MVIYTSWIYYSNTYSHIVYTFREDGYTGYILPRYKYCNSTRLLGARLLLNENGSLLLDILHIGLFA
jgi:hypothetical protein